jgi:hypothetical protein
MSEAAGQLRMVASRPLGTSAAAQHAQHVARNIHTYDQGDQLGKWTHECGESELDSAITGRISM